MQTPAVGGRHAGLTPCWTRTPAPDESQRRHEELSPQRCTTQKTPGSCSSFAWKVKLPGKRILLQGSGLPGTRLAAHPARGKDVPCEGERCGSHLCPG